MNEKVIVVSNGTLTIAGKGRIPGMLQLGETGASFISNKKEEILNFAFSDIASLHNARNGGVTSTVSVKLTNGNAFSVSLERGLACYRHIDTHWTTRPKQVKSRADELSRLADLRGERIVKPSKRGKLRKKPNRSVGGDIVIYLLLTIVALMMAFPLVFAISSSLKPLDELFRFPPTVFPRRITFDNYSDLRVTLGQSWVPFSRYVINTVGITAIGTFGHLIIASMAAFVLAKYDFPGGKAIFAVIVTCLMFTGYVTAIPNYVIMSKLHIIDTYWSLILPAFSAPIGLFMMKQFMEGMPTSLIEAAHIDGAGEFRIFWSIVMPNVKPAWLTVIIFSVQSLWNTSASTTIYSEAKKTLVYALQQIQAGGIARTGQAAAVTVLIMLVPIGTFILSQSKILETMASSGLKD